MVFAFALPCLLEPVKSRGAVWIVFFLSIFPIVRDWDEKLWPSEAELALRLEQRNELVQLRDVALSLRSTEIRAFLAPWWLSPSIAYWSGQPGLLEARTKAWTASRTARNFSFATIGKKRAKFCKIIRQGGFLLTIPNVWRKTRRQF